MEKTKLNRNVSSLRSTDGDGTTELQEHSTHSLEQIPHEAAARGFGQMFGIDPRMILLTFILDIMLFGGEAGTLGASLPISIAAGGVLGFITVLAQRKWGDDTESAVIKGLILGLLTALPTPLPAVIYVGRCRWPADDDHQEGPL